MSWKEDVFNPLAKLIQLNYIQLFIVSFFKFCLFVHAYAMSNGQYPIIGIQRTTLQKSITNPAILRMSSKQKYVSIYPDSELSKFSDYDLKIPNIYKDREPRFYVTVFFGGNYCMHENVSTMISFAKGGNSNKSHDYPKSRYLYNRFYDHELNSANGNRGNIIFPLLWQDEIYQNSIEAVFGMLHHGFFILLY